MRSASSPPYPCDLDPGEFNLASAWWRADQARWVATRHGCGSLDVLERCGCERCASMLDALAEFSLRPRSPRREPPPPPMTTDVGPVRQHVREVLRTGCTRQQLAERAGIDRTTINRLLRGDVARVHVDTAAALLAVGSSAPR